MKPLQFGGEALATASEARGLQRLTLTEQLAAERARLVERMAEIDELLAAIRETPNVQRIIDLIFRQGIR